MSNLPINKHGTSPLAQFQIPTTLSRVFPNGSPGCKVHVPRPQGPFSIGRITTATLTSHTTTGLSWREAIIRCPESVYLQSETQPNPVPSLPSPCGAEHQPEPSDDREPEHTMIDEPLLYGATEPRIVMEPELRVPSDLVQKPAATSTMRENTVYSDIMERSSTHCNMAEGEIIMDLGIRKAGEDLIAWDADLPPLLPTSEHSVTPIPTSSPERAAVPTSCPEKALVSTSSLEETLVSVLSQKRAPVSKPNTKSDPQRARRLTNTRPPTHSCLFLRCCLAAPLLTLSPPSVQWACYGGSTVAPSSLLSAVARQYTGSTVLPRLPPASPWSVVDHLVPRDSTRPASPHPSVPQAPSGSSIPPAPHWSSVTPAPLRPPGSMPPHWSPAPSAPPRPSGSSLSPWLIGSPSPPRPRPPPAPLPSVGPLELSALPFPWLLPL
ncbi:Filamentous hemagglutinin [Labeo rohita]|uniref:Filamentous hemagglutinin n=1 Tax=Labeo rohita TaxID=84645 RepID=A0ABQ8LFA9_LABRO|nr:Filamentous hemagglutinin [Labeo rohita]